MNRSRWFTAGAAMLASAGLHAQQALSSDLNFFGGELPPPPQNGGPIPVRNAADEPKAVAGYAHALVFGDGRELCGELMGMTRDEILWRRPDASDVLRFPRSAVRRIVTGTRTMDSTNGMFPGMGETPFHPPNDHATLKLPGGDWLCSNVTSADGQSFLVQLNDGTQFPIARAQIEWIHFGATPAPAFGFSGTALDMEGWLPAAARMEMAGQTLTVKGASWAGRIISPPNNFEVSFELPEDSEEGTRLWLQPFWPQPNSYGTGTAQIRFGRKEISHLLATDKFNTESSPLPAEALKDKGPVKYRVFYDGTAKRVIVWRNEHPVGDWNYFNEKDPPADPATRTFQFNGLCFDRDNRGENPAPLKFNRLRIRPWDGTLPKAGETEDGQDRLSVAGAAEVSGQLESMTDKALVFSGVTKPRQGGSVMRFFGPAPAVLTGADTKLEFGDQGELIAQNVQVREGKVLCETSFSSTLELPLGALENITFPAPAAQAQPAPAPIDTLVFKNADELIGHALSAALPGAVRWQTLSGQEVEFQPGAIAGVRLAGAIQSFDPKTSVFASTIELRNGERVRGRLVALDEKHVQVEHPLLGSIGLERGRIWHLYPVPRFEAVDGGQEGNGWTWKKSPDHAEGENTSASDDRCIYLDGTYVQPGHRYTGGINMSTLPGVERAVDPALERYEVRFEAAAVSNLPSFMLLLAGEGETSLRATVYRDNLRSTVQFAAGNRRWLWHNIPFGEKLGDTDGRRALRLFVDMKAGTCDLMINGVRILRLGQDASERLLPSRYTVKIQPYPNQRSTQVFSNLWIGPWNGELPSASNAGGEATALSNGDAANGAPKALHDGKFTVASDLGDFDLPVEKTLAVDFGGTMDRQKIAARLRLADGTILNVDRFQWDGHEWAVHSATFGDLRLPGGVVSELVYDPAPAHVPAPVGASKLAQKNPGEPTHD